MVSLLLAMYGNLVKELRESRIIVEEDIKRRESLWDENSNKSFDPITLLSRFLRINVKQELQRKVEQESRQWTR